MTQDVDLRAGLAHWGVSVLRPLPGGHRNHVFLVESAEGRFVAKTTRHSEAALRWLMPVLAVAARCGLNPPVLCEGSDGRFAPGGVTLEPFMPGEPATWSDVLDLQPRLRRLHAALSSVRARPGQGIGTEVPPAHRVALARAYGRLPGPAFTVVHGDVTPSNVLRTADGLSLIDWDEARRDHPAFDTPIPWQSASVLNLRLRREVASGWQVEPHYARTLARRIKARPGPAE